MIGRLTGSTNNALVVLAGSDNDAVVAVYKPIAGERPLFDFPDGTLAKREVAAFLVSEAGGWGIVPPTVLRDGPYGAGMVQQWIDVDPAADVVAMVVGDDPRLRPIALFDAAVNNTDRKGGHLLPLPDGHVFGVDHGVTFSTVPKLRTVLWGWQGEAFEPAERASLERLRDALAGALAAELAGLLDADEIVATRRRVATLLRTGRFPRPGANWPAVPWPPF
jgi:hypothetical protein